MQIIQIYFIPLCFLFVLCNYFKFHNNEIKSHYDLISAMQLMFLLIKTKQMINLAGVAFYTCKEMIKTTKLLKKKSLKKEKVYIIWFWWRKQKQPRTTAKYLLRHLELEKKHLRWAFSLSRNLNSLKSQTWMQFIVFLVRFLTRKSHLSFEKSCFLYASNASPFVRSYMTYSKIKYYVCDSFKII